MSEAFLGEIRIMAFNYAPYGWAVCDGALLSISQNNALYSLLNIYYGGDGRTNFALPDLRGRCTMHVSGSYSLGGKNGEENHTLTVNEMYSHAHTVMGSSENSDRAYPNDKLFAVSTVNLYAPPNQANGILNANTVTLAGGSVAHNNMMPSLALKYCIATTGIYPPRN